MKPKIRVIDIPTTATAEEAERLLNGPCADGYYSDKIVTGLPDSVWARAIFKLRANPEKFVNECPPLAHSGPGRRQRIARVGVDAGLLMRCCNHSRNNVMGVESNLAAMPLKERRN
jgi:hypothetical protein